MSKKHRIRRLESKVHELERQLRHINRQLDPAFDGRTLGEMSTAEGIFVPTTTGSDGSVVTWSGGPPIVMDMGVSTADVLKLIDDSHHQLLDAIKRT